MLEKIISIQGVGVFNDYKATGDLGFRKTTMILAENGHGKSTLCAILRSLQTGESRLLQERRTLGATPPPQQVNLRIAQQNFTFKNDGWSTTYPDMAIYDADFIHDNVYEGDSVEQEHRQNLYNYIVGEQGVTLAREVDRLTEEIKGVNKQIKERETSITPLISSGMPLQNFLKLAKDEAIEEKIKQVEAEIGGMRLAQAKSNEIRDKPSPQELRLPSRPAAFEKVLDQEMESVMEDAEQRLRDHMARCAMDARGEAWIEQGVGYFHHDHCPFCGQRVTAESMIPVYASYFNQAYRDLQASVTALADEWESVMGESALDGLLSTLSKNSVLTEFWRSFIEVPLPPVDSDELKRSFRNLSEAAKALIERKKNSPMERVEVDNRYRECASGVNAWREEIKKYNTAVSACNQAIAAKKQENHGVALKQREVQRNKWIDQRRRHESDAVSLCKAYAELNEKKLTLDGDKKRTKEGLDKYCLNMFPKFQEQINLYLAKFNAGFRLANTRHDYIGSSPRTVYQIEIHNAKIEAGTYKPEEIKPSFKTALSSGDRSALAFAFFMAQLRLDPRLDQKIVIFDDPFNSQDRFRRHCTQHEINDIARKAKQVILLSHDPHFLHQVVEGHHDVGERKTFRLDGEGNKAVLRECDLKAEVKSHYHKNFTLLWDFYQNQGGELLSVAKAIRPFLEGNLRSRFPGRFTENQWLGDFLGAIRSAQPQEGLYELHVQLSELGEINDYSKQFHHDNPAVDRGPINKTELQGFVNRTLRVTGNINR
ncbi:MAG: AAA family ATPase [Magnetococcales bacterium]|nr:AAA family ATPase [Magnetococcales bacterium]